MEQKRDREVVLSSFNDQDLKLSGQDLAGIMR